MFEGLRHRIVGGAPLIARTIRTDLPEGRIGGRLGEVQDAFPDVEIGSYPQMRTRADQPFSVRLVARATDPARLAAAVAALTAMLTELGGRAEEMDGTDKGEDT